MQENKIQVGNTEQVLLSKKNCHRALKVVFLTGEVKS